MSASSAQDAHTAILNVASLLQNPLASGGEVEGSGSFTPRLEWHSDELSFDEPLRYTVSARSAGGEDFVLSGRVSGNVIMPCRRCLTGTEVPASSDFVFELKHRPGVTQLEILYDGDEGEDEVLVFGKPEVDLAQMMTEILAADLPLTVECHAGTECVPLTDQYVQRNDTRTSPFSSLEDLDVES